MRLVLVCHHRVMRAFLERGLREVGHCIAEAAAMLPEAEPIALERQTPQAQGPLANRWISLPALTMLKALDNATGLCHCAAPMAADRGLLPAGDAVRHRVRGRVSLTAATAHPYLAA
ncbi:hypothetical protein [Streptomyces sp. NPDC051098]|uniref:hypothetical protein n=1 Tax=Streptomyces sp. NPDC051098 TaxID=3155411 RepID=UPI003448B904